MSCFVDISLSGKEGVQSKLNKALFLIENPDESVIGTSKTYLSILNDEKETSFSSRLEKSTGIKDWKGVGFQELKRKFPEVLSTDGEPKIYFKRNGSPYLKLGNGNTFSIPGLKLNVKSDQIDEFHNSLLVKILTSKSISRTEKSISSTIKNIIEKNIRELEFLSSEKEAKREELLDKSVDEYGDLLKIEGAEENRDRARKIIEEEKRIFDKIDYLKRALVVDEISSSIGKKIRVLLEEAEGAYIEDVDEKDESGESATELHGKSSDRVSDKLSITPTIRRILSSVPKRIVKNSDPEDMRVNRSIIARILIDEPVYEDFKFVFDKIQFLLNNKFRSAFEKVETDSGYTLSAKEIAEMSESEVSEIRESLYTFSSFEKMMDEIYPLAETDPVIMDLLITLENEINSAETEQDKQAIRTQFVSSFQKGKSQNTFYVASSGIRFVDDVPYENILRSEPAVTEKKREIIAKNFVEIFISSFVKNTPLSAYENSSNKLRGDNDFIEKVRIVTQKNKAKALIERVSSGKAKVKTEVDIYELAKKMSANEIPYIEDIVAAGKEAISLRREGYEKNIYNYFLDRFNISLSEESVSYLADYGAIDFINNIENINSQEVYKQKIVGAKNLAEKLYQEKDKVKKEEIKQIFSDKLNNLALIEAKNSPLASEATTLSNNEKRWLYSNLSKLHLSIIRWKEGDISELEELDGTGNEFVDYLLGYEYDEESSGLSARDTSLVDYSKPRNEQKSKERIERLMVRNNIHVSRLNSGEDISFDVLSKEDMMLMLFTNMSEPRKEIYMQMNSNDLSLESRDKEANKNYFADYINLRNVDKSKTESLSNIPMGGSNIAVDTQKKEVTSIGIENIRRAKNRINGEYKKIAKEYEIINKYLSLSGEEQRFFGLENLIPGWHYQNIVNKRGTFGDVKRVSETKKIDLSKEGTVITEEMFREGAFRKLGFFNDIYEENKKVINEYIDSISKLNSIPQEAPDLTESIDKIMTKALNSEVKSLLELEQVFDIETNVIKQQGETKEHLAGNFAMNYFFTTIDTFNLFSGELGMYKQKEDSPFTMDDPLKRTSAPNADGKYPDITDPTAVSYFYPYSAKLNKLTGDTKNAVPFFRSQKTVFAVVKEQAYFTSEYQDATDKVLNDIYNFSGRKNEEQEESSSGDSLVADGQSFADPDYFEYILDSMYGVTQEDKDLHEELKKESTIINNKHIKFLKKIYGAQQSKKLQSHSIAKPNGTTRVPMFWKSSLFPLYPSVIKGLPIENVAKAMKEQGVDVIAMESAFKNKTLSPTQVHQDVADFKETGELGTMMPQEEIIFNPFLIDTDTIKMQVELSFKEDKSGIVGSQPLRNVQVNMDLNSKEKNYSFRGQNYTGAEMIKIFNESVSDVIIDQLSDFLRKVNYKGPKNGFDLHSLKKMIAEQISDIDEETISILMSDDLPIETVPGLAKAIYPVISKYITKKVAKPSTNSVALIQVANFGFNTPDSSNSNIAFVNKEVKLKPARPTTIGDLMKSSTVNKEELDALIEEFKKTNKDEEFTEEDFDDVPVYFNNEKDGNPAYSLEKKAGYSARIKNAQILMPFSSLVFDSNVTWEEFKALVKEGKIDQRILSTVVGYRIPNQSMASNDSFEIVGFLPPESGNTAILYHEITAKTGSDFDIDKLTMMMANVSKRFTEVLEEKDPLKRNAIEDFNKINSIESYIEEFPGIDFMSLIGLLYRNDNFNSKITEFLGTGEVSQDNFMKKLIINYDAFSKILEKDSRNFEIKTSGVINKYSLQEVFEELVVAGRKRDKDLNEYLASRGFSSRKYFELSGIEYIDDNSKKGNQNKLIEAIQSIISSEESFDDLISPIDSPLVKESIEKEIYEYSIINDSNLSFEEKKEAIIEFRKKSPAEQKSIVSKFRASNRKSLFLANMPFNLSKTRLEMITAKGLVATMANQMVSLPLTQINEVFLKYDLNIHDINEDFGKTHVVGKENNDKMKISKLINYLMNASVDAAKDNYIVEGNLNGYSSNAAMVLFRLGMSPEDVFKILLHPAVVRLSKNKNSSMSKIVEINNEYSEEDLNELSEAFVAKLKLHKLKGEPIKINGDYFMMNAARSSSDSRYKSDNDKDVMGFWNIIMNIGKDLSTSIGVSNPDSKQFGVTFEDSFAKENAMNLNVLSSFVSKDSEGRNINNALTYDREISGIPEFIDETNPDNEEQRHQNYIGSVMNVNISLLHEMLGSAMIETSPAYKKALNLILHNLGHSYSTDAKFIRNVNKALYSYVLVKSGHKATNFDAETRNYLVEEFYKDVLALSTHPELIGNRFLKALEISSVNKTVNFDNLSNYSDQDSAIIKEDFRQIYQLTKNNEGKTDANFGYNIVEKFVQYSFLTTGFNNSGKSFLNKIPSEYYLESGYGFAIKKMIQELSEDRDALSSRKDLQDALLFSALINPGKAVYKKVKDLSGVGDDFLKLLPSKDTGKVMFNKKFLINNKASKQKELAKLITYYDPNLKISRNFALMDQYIGNQLVKRSYVELKTSDYKKSGKSFRDSLKAKGVAEKTYFSDIIEYDLNRIKPENMIEAYEAGVRYVVPVDVNNLDLEAIKQEPLFGLDYSETFLNTKKKRKLSNDRVLKKDNVEINKAVNSISYKERSSRKEKLIAAMVEVGAVNEDMEVLSNKLINDFKSSMANRMARMLKNRFTIDEGMNPIIKRKKENSQLEAVINEEFLDALEILEHQEDLLVVDKNKANYSNSKMLSTVKEMIEQAKKDGLIEQSCKLG